MSAVDDFAHWRARAEEARRIAEQLDDPGARRDMLAIAEKYEAIACRAQERVRRIAD